MESGLLWLKSRIARSLPRAGEMPRWTHYLVASLLSAIVILVYMALVVVARVRGPVRLDATIAGGATLNCQLPDVVQFYLFLFGITARLAHTGPCYEYPIRLCRFSSSAR